MIARFTAAALALVAVAACQQPETAEQMHARMQMESDSARIAIEAQMTDFVAAFNAGQADAIASAYTPNAVLMAPDMPAVTGRENIQASFAGMFAQTPPGTTLAFRILNVTANGPVAVERGTWTMTVPTPDGASTEMRGKYLAEWHKIDGAWLMAADIWNNDAPAPPM